MKFWFKTCILLCLYGFFKELRPSEPFLTEYLLGPYHNLTESQVYYDIYPVWTYSYLSQLVVVFLLTDLLRYKPVIVFEGIGYVATWSLLLWARGVHYMQLMEFFYGIATSTEVAYYTYMYAQVDERYYQKVTSYTRSAILSGKFISSLLSQILYQTGAMDYHSLNYIALASVTVALCISLFLPPVKNSVYFHRISYCEEDEGKNKGSDKIEDICIEVPSKEKLSVKLKKENSFTNFLKSFKRVTGYLWSDFKEAYTNKALLKWSVWWAFATCVNFQVGNYIQPLWESILSFEENKTLYNGATEAISTFFGALFAFLIGYLHLNWNLVGEIFLAVISLLDGALLIMLGLTSNIWIGYINYIIFRVSYQILITIASFQVAKELKAESYGLVFGINMFLALLIQTVLTLIVIEWLEIGPENQFVIYGCYFCVLAFLFFIISAYDLGTLGMSGIKREGIWEKDSCITDRIEAPMGTTETCQ